MIRTRRKSFVESLEPRRLLAGQAPIVSPDHYIAFEDQALVTPADETSLTIGNTSYFATSGNYSTQNLPTDNAVAVIFDQHPSFSTEWAFGFGTADGSKLVEGDYTNASNHAGSNPFLNILAQSPIYNNTITGQFDILQAQYNPDATPSHFAATFTAQTDTGTSLTGTVKFHYSGSVLTNDSDPNGLPLSAVLASPPSHGQLNLTPDGLFTYTPDHDYNGTDTFTYVATDGSATSAPATATIQVTPVNDPPTFTKGADIVVKENAGSVTIPHWATNLSPGPADEAGQTLQFSVSSDDNSWLRFLNDLPTIDPVTGDLTFSVTPGSYGSVTFDASLRDNGGTDNGGQDTTDQTFTITVEPAPDASNDYFSTMENQPLVLGDQTPQTYLWLYSDPTDAAGDHQAHYFTSDFTPFFGGNDTNVDYVPTDGSPFWVAHFYQQDQGLHTITTSTDPNNLAFQISEQTGPDVTSATGEFFIDQAPDENNPNSLAVDFEQHANGSAGTLYGVLRYNYIQPATVLANDATPPGIAATAMLTSAPSHGQITFNSDGSFTYTPANDFTGIDTFTYTESFSGDTSAPATVTINVNPSLPVTSIKGEVENAYSTSDGSHVTTPLADRVVFDDLNNNGELDPGEFSATTALDGTYALPVFAGSSTIRLQELSGWSPPVGYSDVAQVTASTDSAPTDTPLYTAMTHPVVINVAATYSQEFFNSFSNPQAEIRNAFLEANRVYANSDTNILLNLVDIRAANYSESSTLATDLDRMHDPSDGFMDDLAMIRQSTQADIQILFRASPESQFGSDTETIGLSYVFNPAHPDPSLALGVVVSNDGDTLAHEIGHILGAGHDQPNNPDPTTPYAYGYAFTGDDGVLYRDVMSYEQSSSATQVQLPFFSTPEFSYAGQAMGIAGQADNARVVRENAAIVAGYEDPDASSGGGDGGSNGSSTGSGGNNSGSGSSGNAQPLPLTPVALSGPKSKIKPGASVSVSLKLLNIAQTPYTGRLSIQYYLSTDTTFNTSDTSLKFVTLSVKKLKNKHSVSTSMKFKLSKTMPAGTYYVFAMINGQIPSTAATTITVAAPKKKK